MARLNDVTQKATRAAGGVYLDQWDLAATPAGKYRERVEEGGKSLPMRLEDGIHYTEPGGRYVVARLLPRLQRQVRLVPKDANLGVVERHTFRSVALGKRTSYLAWLPRVAAGERVPLLVLLHGADASPDVVAEHLNAALAAAAQQHRIAIVAPDGGADGWWLDSPEHAGRRYASLVATDLLADARTSLPVTDAIGIAGISMGGHGALTLAFAHRDVFRSASSISGVLDLTRASDRAALVDSLGPLVQQRARWEAHSALHQLAQLAKGGRGLAMRISCGSNDRWIGVNRALHERATALQIVHDYDEAPAGHEWSYWEALIPQHVAWHAAHLTAP
jgi:S-formylglutathione hydrolase FrmB